MIATPRACVTEHTWVIDLESGGPTEAHFTKVIDLPGGGMYAPVFTAQRLEVVVTETNGQDLRVIALAVAVNVLPDDGDVPEMVAWDLTRHDQGSEERATPEWVVRLAKEVVGDPYRHAIV